MAGLKIWKKIPGYPDYSVSNYGDVRRDTGTHAGRHLKPGLRAGGKRPGVTLSKFELGTRPKQFYVHTLVCLAFLGPRPDGMEVCHLNDNPQDNRLGNLVYGTSKQNKHHAKLNGRIAQGEAHGRSKLSEREVRAIRHRLRNGEPIRKIAGDFDVHPNTVKSILHGKTWKHLKEETTWQKCKELRVPAWREKWSTSSWKSLGSKLRGFRSRVRRVGNSPVTSSSTSNDPTKTGNGKTSDS